MFGKYNQNLLRISHVNTCLTNNTAQLVDVQVTVLVCVSVCMCVWMHIKFLLTAANCYTVSKVCQPVKEAEARTQMIVSALLKINKELHTHTRTYVGLKLKLNLFQRPFPAWCSASNIIREYIGCCYCICSSIEARDIQLSIYTFWVLWISLRKKRPNSISRHFSQIFLFCFCAAETNLQIAISFEFWFCHWKLDLSKIT